MKNWKEPERIGMTVDKKKIREEIMRIKTSFQESKSTKQKCIICGNDVFSKEVGVCSDRCLNAHKAKDNPVKAALTVLPPFYARESEFSVLDNGKQKIVKEMLSGRWTGFFLYGTVGTGKSCAAAAIAKEYLPNTATTGGYSVVWISAADMLEEIKQDWSSQKYKTCKLLILDDFGTGKTMTEWALGEFFKIIEHRIANDKKTIITSNLEPKELNSYEPRIVSRILGFTQMKFTGNDRRVSG